MVYVPGESTLDGVTPAGLSAPVRAEGTNRRGTLWLVGLFSALNSDNNGWKTAGAMAHLPIGWGILQKSWAPVDGVVAGGAGALTAQATPGLEKGSFLVSGVFRGLPTDESTGALSLATCDDSGHCLRAPFGNLPYYERSIIVPYRICPASTFESKMFAWAFVTSPDYLQSTMMVVDLNNPQAPPLAVSWFLGESAYAANFAPTTLLCQGGHLALLSNNPAVLFSLNVSQWLGTDCCAWHRLLRC
jgi:hypothetical protein